MRINTHLCVVHIAILSLEDVVEFRLQFDHVLKCCLLFSRGLQLAYEVSILVKVVDHGIIRETLDTLLHGKILVDDYLEATSHFFVIDLLTLPRHFLLLEVNNVEYLRTSIKLKPFLHFLFNQVHLLHHERFLPLTALHVLDSLLLYAVVDLFLCSLIDVVKNLELCSCSGLALPLCNVGRIKRLIIVDEVGHIVSCHCHNFS